MTEVLATNTNLSMRIPTPIADSFKEIARSKNLSQGELLELLVNQYNSRLVQNNDISITEQPAPPYDIKLLIRNNSGPATTFSFQGEAISYLNSSRPFFPFSFDYLLQELDFDFTPNEIDTAFQYCIYKIADCSPIPHNFLVYEYFGAWNTETNIQPLNIKRIWFANDLASILNKMMPYISISESEQIEFVLADSISIDKIPVF